MAQANTECWNLLWSRQANCFHLEPTKSTETAGMRFFLKNANNDYLVILSGSQDECYAKAEALRPILKEREEVRRLYEGDQ